MYLTQNSTIDLINLSGTPHPKWEVSRNSFIQQFSIIE